MLLKAYVVSLLAVATATIDKTFIVELEPESSLSGRSLGPHKSFHKRAESLDYTVRHEFNSPATYVGLSLEVRSAGTNEEIKAQLRSIPGVRAVSQVQRTSLPVEFNASTDPFLSYSNPAPLKSLKAAAGSGKLGSSLQMGGIDKLHELGIKGKGIKIGIIDTGVDYRHPALGGGFGPGYKIAGGWAYVDDKGKPISSPDPLTTCYGGGHGTHVAGIIGMESVGAGFDIVGVAPEATLYVYKTFNCAGTGGSDYNIAAMLQAQKDGVDIISMSIGGASGANAYNGDPDPYEDVTKAITNAGIAVIVANGNSVGRGIKADAAYQVESPSSVSTAIGVGAMTNIDFPVVYSAVDSLGATLKYASVWPIDAPDGLDVYLVGNGCDGYQWAAAIDAVSNINNTIFVFSVGSSPCEITSVGGWSYSSTHQTPPYILGFNQANDDKYWQVYDTPSQGFFGTAHWTNLNNVDGLTLLQNYNSAGGYGKYKLTFASIDFESPQQPSGGFMDYYSSWGPVWHNYNLKPQVSAPGGHTLSTWPLGDLGGYVILSGTSMATPYVSGCYALVKSQFPHLTKVEEILNLIQTNASPLPWIYDPSIVAATAQQGAGQINPYKAIFASSTVSPGQIKITDVNHRNYGTGKVVIKNASKKSKTYTLSHQGAGYTDYYLGDWPPIRENNTLPKYGSATFNTPQITLAAGKSSSVSFAVTPPKDVDHSKLPVFGGFIKVADTDGETFSVPYIGAPYSLYNAEYLAITTSGFITPSVYGHNTTTGDLEYDNFKGFIEIDPTLGWGWSFGTREFINEASVDFVPANTKLKATHYGYNVSNTIKHPAYQAVSAAPTSSIFGEPSYGSLWSHLTGWSFPGGSSNTQKVTSVKADDGSKVIVGNGDVRMFIRILRTGGVSGTERDYETYLGPIIRIINVS